MKRRMARYLLTAVGMMGVAGAPALFAGELHHDYENVERQNADLRADRYRLHEAVEHGNYWEAARLRDHIRRDYERRERQVRDIRRDEFRRDEYRGNDFRDDFRRDWR